MREMEPPVALFIDDEPAVLRALRRALRPCQRDWEMLFLTDQEEALETVSSVRPWVVFADRMMMGMDGLELLERVIEQEPEIIRVLLTGNVTRETAVAAARTAHFLLRKPFEIEQIRDVLVRARVLRQLPMSDQLRRELGAMRALPVLPEVFHRISAELNSEEPDIDHVAALISQDQGLLSKVLQVVNAPFFGFQSPTTSAQVAVMRLGLETIRSLVLLVELYHRDVGEQQSKLADLLHEAMALADLMSALGGQAGIKTSLLRDGLVCALLHNIGRLVCDDESRVANDIQRQEPVPEADIAGAYLLELWGFSSTIVEALAHQDDPLPSEELGELALLLNSAKKVFVHSHDVVEKDAAVSEAVERIQRLRSV